MSTKKPRLAIDDCFRKKKIIPYLNDEISDSVSMLSQAPMVFLQVNELSKLSETLAPFSEPELKDVVLMLHLDLVRGLARDDAAVRYIAGFERIDGIITVHHQLVAPAQRLGLLSILRFFLQDARAIDRGIGIAEKTQPDAIELLPCVAAIEVADRFERLYVPLIAGGLVNNLSTAQRALDSNCHAVSTSNRELWKFNTEF